MAGKLGEIVSTLSRGVKRVQRHPIVATFGIGSLLILIFNPFNWLSWPELFSLVDRGMAFLLGAQWAASPPFRIACLLVILAMLWWVGRQAKHGDRATTVAIAKHSREVSEQNEAIAKAIAAHRNNEMAKWDRIVSYYFRQRRFDDATAAMGILRAAIAAYPQQVDAVKGYHSNYHFAIRPWDNLGHTAREQLRNVAIILGVDPPDPEFSEPRPPLRQLQGGTMDTLFDEANAGPFFEAHSVNAENLQRAANELQQHLDNEADALIAARTQIDEAVNA